ncbi:uncharacterized protein LOC112231812 isoform X2 [Oncorhynchus tshawytscha]|uniref:uncharacterized protein LOC112231812 isoform X2 n=1 Tax=Oncorhynchus tshawytscha TaxID=74940 RepID=UPI001C3C23BE|nr:uncharacterized protein LOC112231812 isoform X2 [Oncorhynchus tshawytscha]
MEGDEEPGALPMDCAVSDPVQTHDYCAVPEPAALAPMAIHEHVREIEALRAKLEKLTTQRGFGRQRFAGSDDDIRVYTRFASYTHLMAFWHLIEQAAETKFIRVTSTNPSETSVTRRKPTLPSIDEFFLFMTHLSLGLKQKDLAHRFSIHQSTVSRIIISWANFLYCLRGSARIWIPKKTIKAHLPVQGLSRHPGEQKFHVISETRNTVELQDHPGDDGYWEINANSCKHYGFVSS